MFVVGTYQSVIKYKKGDKFRIVNDFYDPSVIYEALEDSLLNIYAECVWFLHRGEKMGVWTKYTEPYVGKATVCDCDIMDLMRKGCTCGFLKRSEAT